MSVPRLKIAKISCPLFANDLILFFSTESGPQRLLNKALQMHVTPPE